MKPITNYDKIKASGEFERLPAGGYVIRITACEDKPDVEYLVITYDIFEGAYKDHFKDSDAEHVFTHQFIRSYKATALGMFKAFTNALEDSNSGYKWDWNEKALAGKLLGVVLREEEYENNRGEVKTGLKVYSCISADRVRTGDYKVPGLKKLAAASSLAAPVAGFTPIITDDDVPF